MNQSYTLRNKRVWVAGHRGLVGSALVRRLQGEGCEIVTAPRDSVDLRRPEQLVAEMVEADRTILRTTGVSRHEPILHAAQ